MRQSWQRVVLRTAVAVLVLVVALFLGACGGDEEDAAATSAASKTTPNGEAIVIQTTMKIAATPGSEPIATGDVMDASTLGGSAFCTGGTIRDSHGNPDPTVEPYGPVDRTITCPDGTVRMGITPEITPGEPQGQTQKGTWKIAGGTGAFEGLRGGGKMEIVYGPDEASPVHETLNGTVTRER